MSTMHSGSPPSPQGEGGGGGGTMYIFVKEAAMIGFLVVTIRKSCFACQEAAMVGFLWRMMECWVFFVKRHNWMFCGCEGMVVW